MSTQYEVKMIPVSTQDPKAFKNGAYYSATLRDETSGETITVLCQKRGGLVRFYVEKLRTYANGYLHWSSVEPDYTLKEQVKEHCLANGREADATAIIASLTFQRGWEVHYGWNSPKTYRMIELYRLEPCWKAVG